MVQTHLIGCQIGVAEGYTPDGEQIRSIVVTSPAGDSWIVTLSLLQADQIGRALRGQAIVVPNGNGAAPE